MDFQHSVPAGIALGGQTLNASRTLPSKGKCSRLLRRNCCLYHLSLSRKCLKIISNFVRSSKLMCLLRKESLQEVQLQTLLESYQVRGNVLAYWVESVVCTLLSLSRKCLKMVSHFVRWSKLNCFLPKESFQEVHFQTHNVCTFLSLPRKSFQLPSNIFWLDNVLLQNKRNYEVCCTGSRPFRSEYLFDENNVYGISWRDL